MLVLWGSMACMALMALGSVLVLLAECVPVAPRPSFGLDPGLPRFRWREWD